MSRAVPLSASVSPRHRVRALAASKAPAAKAPTLKAPVSTLALYEQVKQHITHKIQNGSWPAGHRLPSEHELVAQFGISRRSSHTATSGAAEMRSAAISR